MTHLIETCAAVILAGWVLHRFIAIGLPRDAPRHWAPMGGYGAMLVAGYIGGAGFGVFVSFVAPLGVMLPLLCLASSARALGLYTPAQAPRGDLLVFALLMLLVALGAAGFGPVNPYAWFYAGLGPVLLAGGLALWAVWRKQVVVLVAVVLGQVLWLADIGSSNLYDQLTHPALFAGLLFTGLGVTFEGFRRLIRL